MSGLEPRERGAGPGERVEDRALGPSEPNGGVIKPYLAALDLVGPLERLVRQDRGEKKGEGRYERENVHRAVTSK